MYHSEKNAHRQPEYTSKKVMTNDTWYFELDHSATKDILLPRNIPHILVDLRLSRNNKAEIIEACLSSKHTHNAYRPGL